MGADVFNPELKRGSLELLILAVLEAGPRHGYEVGRLLERRSGGALDLSVSTLYSILYRMEQRKWIKARWVERPRERRRCCYTLTPAGTATLARQRKEWRAFSAMVSQMIGASHA